MVKHLEEFCRRLMDAWGSACVSYKHSIQENAKDLVTECLPIIRRIMEEKHNCPGTSGIQPEVGSSRKSRKLGCNRDIELLSSISADALSSPLLLAPWLWLFFVVFNAQQTNSCIPEWFQTIKLDTHSPH